MTSQGAHPTTSIAGDEILVWRVIAPGDVIEGVGGPLFNPGVNYPVVLVPGHREAHYLNAVEKGFIGKIPDSGDRTNSSVLLRNVLPLHSYHVGYKEGPYWHWATITVPLRLRPMGCTDRTVSVHLDFSHREDVVAVRTVVTSSSNANGGGFRKEREYLINDLPVDEVTEMQFITFRNLFPCCAYHIEARPLYSDGTEGGSALTTRIVTQTEVVLCFQEIGDTYLRIGFRRPPPRHPLHDGVRDEDAVIEEYVLRVWEDPTASLIKNATRLSRGRQPQRYPLRKGEYTGKRLPCGVMQVVVVENLKPNTAHFVTLQTRAPIAEQWDPRMARVRVKTCSELVLPIEPPRLTSTSVSFAWQRGAPEALPFCDADIQFPHKSNLFDDREVPNPYIGANVVELPDGFVWNAPTTLSANGETDRALLMSSSTPPPQVAASFEVSVTDVARSTTRIHAIRQSSRVSLSGLHPSSTYIIKVRTIPVSITNTRGDTATPWSRPYVVMTPSDVLFRPLHRSHDAVTVAWGRLTPSTWMTLDFEPGRYKYLPDVDATDPNAPFYYYLEPLPFLCGDHIDAAELSDSEDEEEVYADGCVTGSGVGYLGKRLRILNREPRPRPASFECSIDQQEYDNVAMVVFGFRESTSNGDEASPPEHSAHNDGLVALKTIPSLELMSDASPPSASIGTEPGQVSHVSPEALAASALGDSSTTLNVVTDAVIRRWQSNFYRDSITLMEEVSNSVLPNGMTAICAVTNMPASGVQRFEHLCSGSQLQILCFSQSRVAAPYPRLSSQLELFTLPSDAVMGSARSMTTPSSTTCMPQLLWSKHLCNNALSNDRVPFLELKEVSEVFVTLRIGLRRAKECSDSLHLALLDTNALEWSQESEAPLDGADAESAITATATRDNSEAASEDEEEDEEGDDDDNVSPAVDVTADVVEAESSHVEYLLAVEQVEIIEGVRTVIGKRREVYYCTKKPVVQLIDLTAASRFDVSVATVSTKNGLGWTAFSEPITFTTVQKLLFEMEEISTEYINLKWGRSRLDRIRDYSIIITDLSLDAHSSRSNSIALTHHSNSLDTPIATSIMDGNSAAPSGVFSLPPHHLPSNAMSIQTAGTRYRLDTQRQLRPNGLFDCMVIPHYTNGQRGLDSNVLRFLQCSLGGTIVEAGVAHLKLEWTPPPLHALIPTCPNAASDADDGQSDSTSAASIVSVCLIRLRDASRTWERTVQCNPAAGSHTFEGLNPETKYDAHIALIALLPRCTCCKPPQPKSVLPCCEPFSLSGETLGQPSARISRVWENALEVEYLFESEPTHEGQVSLELCLVDRKHAENTLITLRADANGKHGKGSYVAQGLNPGRAYHAQLRQQYSQGTWGEWKTVLHGIRTLPKLTITMESIAETTFGFRASRETFVCGDVPGMEFATQEHPQRFRFRVELLGKRQKVLSSSALRSTTAMNGTVSADMSRQQSARGSARTTNQPQSPLDNDDDDDGDSSSKDEETSAAIEPQNTLENQQSVGTTPLMEVVASSMAHETDDDEDDTEVRFIETNLESSLLPGLEPNTPYKITAQQWALDDWGTESQPIHSYTLNQMILTVARRCDSYFEVHCARDKRLPLIPTTLCRPHNETSTNLFSRLIGVTLTATSLVTNIMTTRFFLACTEKDCPSLVGRISDLESSHPYRVDVRTEYENKESCPIFTSVATITATVPVMKVVALGEDFVSVMIDKKSAPASLAQAQDAFHALPSAVRHAAMEGHVVDIVAYHFRFIPIHFDEDDDVEKPQTFQNRESTEEMVSVISSAAAFTKTGLMSEIPYNIFLHTVDERDFSGKEHLIGAICTRSFPKIFVNKLSENFAEIEWREDEEVIGEDHTVVTVSGAISKRFGRWLRVAPCPGYNVNDNGNVGDFFEFVIAEDIAVPDVTRPATRTASIPYNDLCSLVEQLNPETQYFVIGRCRRRYMTTEGTYETHCSAWGSPTRFATLALLVLRVVHCSLDFANVAWQDPVSTSPVERSSHTHGPGNLGDELWGSTTSFTKQFVNAAAAAGQGVGSLAAGSAQAVRFQLRLMHATPEGECGAVIQDMYVVTADGIHTIEHLIPGKSYAVSMRVCYEGLSGSWVAPAVFRTDRFPEPRYLSLTRRDVEMELDLEAGGELRDAEDLQVPDRNHRLYEVLLSDSEHIRFVLFKVHEPTRLFIAGLSRGRRYRAAIREVINGVRYGAFVHLCSFWMQPYPPMIVRLLENRDGCCEIEWRVIEKKNQVAREEEEDVDYVYQLQQGVRSTSNPAEGTDWKEVVITDTIKHRFKWTQNLPDGARDDINFSELCFRVRCSKCFVLQNGLAYKTPVWGDWSLIAYWNEAQPPHSVTHLGIAYSSDTFAIAKWDLPRQWEMHPGLRYIVKIRIQEHSGSTGEGAAAPSSPTSPTSPSAEVFQWHTVGTTPICAVELPNLAKATTYVVAVQSESSFGINPQLVAISFTTRYVPNRDPKPEVHDVAPRPLIPQHRLKELLLPGMRPVDPFETFTSNLYDKYEEPRRLRLRAVVRMAGMLDRTKRGEMLKQRFQCLIRRLITTQKVVHRYAADVMMQPNFKANEVLSPEQVARLRFGLDPDDGINIWTKEFEEFLQTEEHDNLRRTFTFRSSDGSLTAPGSLMMYKRKKSTLSIKMSAVLDRRRSHASTPTLRHSASVSKEEGVSWTTDDAQPRRASTSLGMRSRSVVQVRAPTPVEKNRPLHGLQLAPIEERPALSIKGRIPSNIDALIPSALATPVATAPASPFSSSPSLLTDDKRKAKKAYENGLGADAPLHTATSGQKKTLSHMRLPLISSTLTATPTTHSKEAKVPSPSLHPAVTPKITAESSLTASIHGTPQRLVTGVAASPADDAMTAVDPAPMLPFLMRSKLLATLQR
jgi:hypothetical protein